MKIILKRIEIENFRGIEKCDIHFEDTNFFIGNNGTGKTTLMAAISRLMPILRGENRIFLDSDFFLTLQQKQKKYKSDTQYF